MESSPCPRRRVQPDGPETTTGATSRSYRPQSRSAPARFSALGALLAQKIGKIAGIIELEVLIRTSAGRSGRACTFYKPLVGGVELEPAAGGR
jgi:hypothetical protein